MNRVLAILAFAIFCAFLVILAFEVPSPDLVIIIVVTLCFVAWDFVTSSGDRPE